MEAMSANHHHLESPKNESVTKDDLFLEMPIQPTNKYQQDSDELFPKIPASHLNGPILNTATVNAVIESHDASQFETCTKGAPSCQPPKRSISPVSQHSEYDNQPRPNQLTNDKPDVYIPMNGPQNGLPLICTGVDQIDYPEPTHVLSYAPSITSLSSTSASSSSTSGPDSVVDSDDDEAGDSSTERALFERLIANPRIVTPRSGSLCSENFEQVIHPPQRQSNTPTPTTNGRSNFYRGIKPGSITSLTSLNGSPWEGFSLPPTLNNVSNNMDYPNSTSTLPASYKSHPADVSDVISTNKYMLMFDGISDKDKLQKEGESLIEKLQRLNDDPESVV